jgi:hypothetical protein
VLCDGCLLGACPVRSPASPAWSPSWCSKVTDEDGSAAETYRGVLTVAGVRYAFEVLLFADLDGAYFVANVSRFAPVEWSAVMRGA